MDERNNKRILAATVIAATLTLGSSALLAGESMEQRVKEGWREGSIQASYLLNEHLNPVKIDVDVQNHTAVLTGIVESEVSKALASEIALSVDGIEEVDNRLEVAPEKAPEEKDQESEIARALSDTAITTKVKSRLLANSHASGSSISVETENGVVTLTGTVPSEAESELAYYITRNTDGVREVNNKLQIGS